MPLPQGVTLVDLRPAELRFAQPLEKFTALPVRVVSLSAIEAGQHGLTATLGPLLVICERGIRSSLAVRYLQADGLSASHYPGGVNALIKELTA